MSLVETCTASLVGYVFIPFIGFLAYCVMVFICVYIFYLWRSLSSGICVVTFLIAAAGLFNFLPVSLREQMFLILAQSNLSISCLCG